MKKLVLSALIVSAMTNSGLNAYTYSVKNNATAADKVLLVWAAPNFEDIQIGLVKPSARTKFTFSGSNCLNLKSFDALEIDADTAAIFENYIGTEPIGLSTLDSDAKLALQSILLDDGKTLGKQINNGKPLPLQSVEYEDKTTFIVLNALSLGVVGAMVDAPLLCGSKDIKIKKASDGTFTWIEG
jgi:hypothetical protein